MEAALIQQIESKSCQEKTEKKKSSGKGYDDWQRKFEKNLSEIRDFCQFSLLILSDIKQIN